MSGIDRLIKVLEGASRVAIDSMGFIYHFEANKMYVPLTRALFDRVEQGKLEAVTSLITVAEVFSNQAVIKDEELAAEYRHVFDTWPNLTIFVPDMTDAMLVGAVRLEYGLRLPDAFQVEAGLSFGAEILATNDERLRVVRRPKPVILRDYLD
mgnify:CR=1 FL=1